jgi:HMG (high mobility group) box
MQEIGKQWQSLSEEQKQYFKHKADRDKVRYLTEQKAFYDEVEMLGKSKASSDPKLQEATGLANLESISPLQTQNKNHNSSKAARPIIISGA